MGHDIVHEFLLHTGQNNIFPPAKIDAAEQSGASKEELQEILGKGKAQQGIFLGDIENGELEIGQVCSIIRDIPTVKEIVDNMISEFEEVLESLEELKK